MEIAIQMASAMESPVTSNQLISPSQISSLSCCVSCLAAGGGGAVQTCWAVDHKGQGDHVLTGTCHVT